MRVYSSTSSHQVKGIGRNHAVVCLYTGHQAVIDVCSLLGKALVRA